MRILQNLASIQERINSAAAKAGRNPQDIKLVTVTKTIELPEIIEAVKSGVKILGESRVQEAQEKISNFKFQISNSRVEWHLIGSLQRNKAKYAVQLFDLIHTIDSIELAEEVDRQAGKKEKTQRILVQIKLSEEETKHGVLEKDLMELLDKVSNMKNLKLEGLMTIPLLLEDPELIRPYFRKLREIRDKLSSRGYNLPELSMGMSNDYEVAVEEGATLVRVGTAIFGTRHA